MTAAPDAAVEADAAPAYGTPEAATGMQPVPDDDTALDDLVDGVRELVIAGPVALLGAGNAATIAGSTAFMTGGPAGLAAAAAGVTGAAGLAYVARRAHRREQAAQEGKPDPKAVEKAAKTAEKAQKQAAAAAKTAARAQGKTKPTTGAGGRHAAAGSGLSALKMPSRPARKGPAGFTLPKPTGGGTGSAGRGVGAFRGSKPSSPSGKRTGAATGGSKTAAGSAAGKAPGLPSLPTGGKAATVSRSGGTSGSGKAGASRGSRPGLLSRFAGAGRTGSSAAGGNRGSSASRGAGAHRGSRGPAAAAGRIAGAAKGKAAVAKSAKQAATQAATSGSPKSTRLGRAAKAVAGSRAVRAARGAGRGIGQRITGAYQGAKRGYSTGRAAIAGAAKARGQSPRQVAAATRRAVTRRQAQHAKTQGRKIGRIGRLRRRATGALLAGTAAGTVAATRTARTGGTRGMWLLAVLTAWARQQPLPLRPDLVQAAREAEAARRAAAGHPPVAATVNPGPTTAPPTQGAAMANFGQTLTGLADQAAQLAASYSPDGMLEYGSDLAALEGFLTSVASVFEALEHGADDLPVEKPVVDAISAVVSFVMSASSAAGEIAHVFETVHSRELERLRNPRSGESKWDMASN